MYRYCTFAAEYVKYLLHHSKCVNKNNDCEKTLLRARLDCLTKPSDISHLTKFWNLNFVFVINLCNNIGLNIIK